MSKKIDRCIDRIESIDFIRENETAKRYFDAIKNRVNDRTYKLAVVGEFSSGKSTFINALIGKDILKHAKSETTATITYVHNVRPGDQRINTAKVNYCDERSIFLDTLDDIQRYTTVQSDVNVAEEILSVDIYVNFLDVKEEIVIVDTPGLNGLADRHREITINEIRKAHACIYIMQLRGITNTDTEFLKILIQYQKTFIFVQNFIDELHVSEGESVSGKLEEDKAIVRRCFEAEEYKAYFCGISALMALTGRDQNIKRLYENSKEDIDIEQRNSILRTSGYFEFIDVITSIIDDKKIKREREKDDCSVVIGFINEMLEILTSRQESIGRIRDADYRNRDVASLKKIRDDIKSGQERVIKLLNNCIDNSFVSNRKRLIQDSSDMIQNIYNEMESEIKKVSDYEDFQERMHSQSFENALDKKVVDLNCKLEEEKRVCLNYTYKLVLARMDEYDCSVERPSEIRFDFDDIGQQDFIAEDDKRRLGQMRGKVNADTDEIRRLEKEERRKEEKEKEFEKKMSALKGKTEQIKVRYEADLEAMKGREPKIEHYYKEVSRSGLWGRLKDAFKGKEKKKYSDDSKHRRWENEMEQIKRKYYAEIRETNDERDRLEDMKRKILGELDKLKADKNKLDRDVRRNTQYIDELENTIRIKEENIKREYLAKLKRRLLGNVQDYLFGGNGLENLVKSNIETDMRKNIRPIKEMAAKEYTDRVKNRIMELEKMIANEENELCQSYTDYSHTICQLTEIKTILEEEIAS